MIKERTFLKICRSYFHLRSLDRIVVSFPMMPVDAIGVGLVSTVMIEAIQVCLATGSVPPSSFKGYGAMAVIRVIILVLSRKRSAALKGERVTSSSWVENNNDNKK